jgi:hypothetical protein
MAKKKDDDFKKNGESTDGESVLVELDGEAISYLYLMQKNFETLLEKITVIEDAVVAISMKVDMYKND